MRQQECIPVGCVPPASLAVSLCPEGGVYPAGCLPHTPPRGQTDACENITLPHISFTGGNNSGKLGSEIRIR